MSSPFRTEIVPLIDYERRSLIDMMIAIDNLKDRDSFSWADVGDSSKAMVNWLPETGNYSWSATEWRSVVKVSQENAK